jgi:hypothetical protein
MGTSITIASILSSNTQRMKGIQTHLKNGKVEVSINGQNMKVSDVTGAFQASVDAQAAVSSAYGKYKIALAAREATEEQRRLVDDGLKNYVFSRFGADSEAAHDFGYAPKKVTPPDVETKAKAARKGLATREARGTMGKKERLKIKGVLPEDAVATTATAAPVVTSAAPASAAVLVAPAGK